MASKKVPSSKASRKKVTKPKAASKNRLPASRPATTRNPYANYTQKDVPRAATRSPKVKRASRKKVKK